MQQQVEERHAANLSAEDDRITHRLRQPRHRLDDELLAEGGIEHLHLEANHPQRVPQDSRVIEFLDSDVRQRIVRIAIALRVADPMGVFDAKALAPVGLRHAQRPERGLIELLPGPVLRMVAVEHVLVDHRRSGAAHGPLLEVLVERLADREGVGPPLGLAVASAQVREVAPLEVGLLGGRQGREEVGHA
ncbi:hypothetical protein ACN28I_29665 [Archangium gephyra]|uniref:hypothetical protein n=1 Tax=Archangium gephyra TaxID=48 RepID=UPI003B80BBFF